MCIELFISIQPPGILSLISHYYYILDFIFNYMSMDMSLSVYWPQRPEVLDPFRAGVIVSCEAPSVGAGRAVGTLNHSAIFPTPYFMMYV